MYDKRLDTLLKVAESGSFSKAAQALYITPAAVIKQMNQLEGEYGLTIFNRTKRGVTLTPVGASLLDSAKQIIEAGNRALVKARHIRQNEDLRSQEIFSIRLGSSMMYPYKPLMQRFAHHREAFSHFRFAIVSIDDKRQSLLELLPHLGDEIDMIAGLCDFYSWTAYCTIYPLGELPFTIAVPRAHRLADKGILRPSDMIGERLFLLHPGSSRSVDAVREDLSRSYPEIEIVEGGDVYDLDSFNQAEIEQMLVLSYNVWTDIHPGFVNLPVLWKHTSSYGLICPREPPLAVWQFLTAITEAVE